MTLGSSGGYLEQGEMDVYDVGIQRWVSGTRRDGCIRRWDPAVGIWNKARWMYMTLGSSGGYLEQGEMDVYDVWIQRWVSGTRRDGCI